MRRPQILTTGRLIGAAIALGASFIFISDLTPVRGAADGAAYGVVIAAAGHFGRRTVIFSAALAAVLTVAGPFLGAEGDETMLQIVAGRAVGLVVIFCVAGVLLHLLKMSASIAASRQEITAHHESLLQIARFALLADKPFKERLEFITELTVKALGVDAACIAHMGESGSTFKLYDVWNRHLARHFEDNEAPASYAAEIRYLMDHDLACPIDDVRTSPLHQDSLDYFEQRNIRAVLHTAALHGESPVGSLIASCIEPHHWTEREIVFAKSVSHVVALLFAVDHSERTLARLDMVSQSIFVEGAKGRIEYANRAARELGGCADADCMPALPFALTPLTGDADQQQIRFGDRELEVHRTRLGDGDMLIRVDDVTARNLAEAERKRMEALLEQSAKLQSMGQLAAGVAHDFNNILGAIMGFAQLLAKRVAGRTEEAAFAERILRACAKGKELTDEILAYARTSSVERAPIDLAQVVAGLGDVIPVDAGGAAWTIINAPKQRLPVSGNATQLMQLIQNLVVNARHACEGNGGDVTISTGRAEGGEVQHLIYASEERNERLLGVPDQAREYCFVRVADKGDGIAPENLNRIFEPFFTTKGRRRGSGLGLAVVHRVVEAHGGCCHVRSEVGNGTAFTIYLPLLSNSTAAAKPQPAEVAAPVPAAQGAEKVLIVDDDIDVADALMAGLEQLGYSTVVLEDPQEALALLRQVPDACDVLVTDQVMPGLKGHDLIRAVRSFGGGVKIILYSGTRGPGVDEPTGADVFLQKPVSPTDIALQIRALFRDSAATAA